MGDLGSIALLIALALSSYSAIGSCLGQWRRSIPIVESARYAAYLTLLALVVSTIGLVGAFVAHDFELKYVAEHSSLAMPAEYTWVAIYAGNEGSLLFIALVLSALSAIALYSAKRQQRDILPYVTAVMMVVLTFFLAVMTVMADPFARLDFIPVDGQGMNPLLTHPGMFIHPPMLMTGLIAFTIPFAFANGALLAGRVGDEWVDAGRIWGLLAWMILGTGLLLGAWWAYTILGWGGYWGWDPVENSGLMPFLGMTAFIHSIMVQKRRGMFRMWNIVLINVSFALALFGMFINRGGPVPSVHSFGASNLGLVFLVFLGAGLLLPFALFFWRYGALKSAQHLESSISREAAFLVNNLLLLAIAFVTLWGVIFPLVSEAFKGVTITVGTPFYNQVNGPLFLALIFLMGVGPMLPWRRGSLKHLKNILLLPMMISLGVTTLLAFLGVNKPYALIGFGLCSLVTSGILLEWGRGTRTKMRQGTNAVSGFVQLVANNRPRYGGYIVHLAIISLALGIVGSSFYGEQKDALLAVGESSHIGDYQLKYVGSTSTPQSDRTEERFHFEVYQNGDLLERMTASRTFYSNFDMANTRAAIRSNPIEDLYVVPSEIRKDGRVGFRIFVNPLVWWLWIAGPILIVGTIIALWPERQTSPVTVTRAKHIAQPQPVDVK